MNVTRIAEESGKTHEYTQEWVYILYLGIRKDREALDRAHASMRMLTWKYIIIGIPAPPPWAATLRTSPSSALPAGSSLGPSRRKILFRFFWYVVHMILHTYIPTR